MHYETMDSWHPEVRGAFRPGGLGWLCSACLLVLVGCTSAEWTNSLGMRFRYVAPGRFRMGCGDSLALADVPAAFRKLEEPYEAHLREGIYVCITEVTNEQFEAFIEATGYKGGDAEGGRLVRHLRDPKYASMGGPEQPVVYVSRVDARAFCEWLSEKEGREYRLPTETEWEYACKAGGGAGHCGHDGHGLAKYAWYKPNSDGHPHRVGTKQANEWGLHDMLGNVWEWTSTTLPPEVVAGAGLQEHAWYIIRGGSYMNVRCRCTARWAAWPPEKRSAGTGFRIVCEVEELVR